MERVVVDRLSLGALSSQDRNGWEQLLESDERQALFVTPEWLAAWAATVGRDWQPLVLHARRAERTLAVLALGLRPPGPTHFATLSHLAAGYGDYLGPLADGREGEAALAACLDALLETDTAWRLLDLPGLPADSPAVASLVRAARARGCAIALLRGYPCPELAIDGPWPTMLARRSANFRSWLGRKRRRLERTGAVRFVHCRHPDEVGAALEVALRIHARRWQRDPAAGFLSHDPQSRRFLFHATLAYARRGWADLAFLELDGRALAFALTFRKGRRCSYFLPAHDPSFASYSPGSILLAHLIEQACDEGLAAFDFMLGDEDYKYRWAARQTWTLRLLLARPGLEGRFALAAARARLRLRAALRQQPLARRLRARLPALDRLL